MRGDENGGDTNDNCEGAIYNKDFPFITSSFKSPSGAVLNPDDVAIPCGMAARSYFNDTYTIQDSQGNTIPVSEKNIAWLDDRAHRFKNIDLNKQWIDMESERFMNWMKVSPFSNVHKVWGRIDTDLPKGQYTINIVSRWNSELFGGEKYWGLTTTNALGSDNSFMGVTYIVIGGLSLLMGVIFLIRKIQRPKGVLSKQIEEVKLNV